ncbi:MAG TPA: hypothetical protein ENK44_09400 [Caldithrix abyssi]|uniref:AbiEi antitoxin N-terminal domain-containing protein n=1 Tax=Caldithrix abyssi TaxID=187145 RepID=A0A7V4WVZ0_CALAY|nr:hypothetical protein [Caldithrix abyssi]
MNANDVIKLFEQQNYYLQSDQLIKRKIHTSLIHKMLDDGLLEKVKRGLYRLPPDKIPEHESFTFDYFDAAKAVPKGIFCLTTALYYHGLSTQRPAVFDMAIPRTQRTPKLFTVFVRFYRFQEPYYSYGVQEIKTKIATIKIYNKEKAICDAFRQRRIIGEDIAVESLNAYLKQSKKDINRLIETAVFCKVKHLIEPVVKAMVGF